MTQRADMCLYGKSVVRSYRQCIAVLGDRGFAPTTMRGLNAAAPGERLYAMRHDVDHSITKARLFAEIESSLGIASTYYLLPPGDYDRDRNYYGWLDGDHIVHDPACVRLVAEMSELGHEIGIHHDFVQLSERLGRPVAELFAEELAFFRQLGIDVVGACSHGSRYVRRNSFTNYDIFARDQNTNAGRVLSNGKWSFEFGTVDQGSLGLEYEAYWVRSDVYISDVGSATSVVDKRPGSIEKVDDGSEVEFERLLEMQGIETAERVIMLTHPEWWKPAPGTAAGVSFASGHDKEDATASEGSERHVELGIDDFNCAPACPLTVEASERVLAHVVNRRSGGDVEAPLVAFAFEPGGSMDDLGAHLDAVRDGAFGGGSGVYARFLSRSLSAADVVAIDAARNVRLGRPVEEPVDYRENGETRPHTWPACPLHWGMIFGLFVPAAGGNGEKLVAYLSLRRWRDVALLSGFENYLERPEEMYTLVAEAVRWFLDADTPYAAGTSAVVAGQRLPAAGDLHDVLEKIGFEERVIWTRDEPLTLMSLVGEPYPRALETHAA